MKKIERIFGEKVILEPFCLEKAAEFFELYQTSQPVWNKFITMGFVSCEQAESYIAQQMKSNFTAGYFILEKLSEKMVGFILGDQIFGKVLIARTRAVGVAFEKKGYAREAASLFNWWAKLAGFIGVVAFICPKNTRAVELVVREGFKKQDVPVQSPMGQPLLVYAKEL